MLRQARALLAGLARARAGAWRGAAGSGEPQAEQERFVFPEYELPPEPRRAGSPRAAPRPRREAPPPRLHQHQPPRAEAPPVSGSCVGCGVELQSGSAAAPGFVSAAGLREGLCRRCRLLAHGGRAPRLELPPERHRLVLRAALRRPPRHGRRPLLLCVLDALELPEPLLPQLPALLSAEAPAAALLVVANKVDLLPLGGPEGLARLRRRVRAACARAGLRGAPLADVRLVSAKTGFGVEGLVSALQRSWRAAGDVYLLGAANAGKSALFNALLRSDYCKARAPDIVHCATVSPWPGTTLGLLKFPIINPTCDRIFRRRERLRAEAEKTEEELSEEELKYLNRLKKEGYLVGRVGRTFQRSKPTPEIDFDPDLLSYSVDEDPGQSPQRQEEKEEFSYNEVKDARWCFDTPGIMRENCLLNLLTDQEVKLVSPTRAIVPRTFILKPQMVLFLAALARIDYLEGEKSAWFTVMASHLLPVHVTTLGEADAVYEKYAGKEMMKVRAQARHSTQAVLLGRIQVPMGGEERMKQFPRLVAQDFALEGIGATEAVADIKLCSAGWVAVTAHAQQKLQLRAHMPEGATLTLRQPPLLPHVPNIRGARIQGTAAYRTKKPPALVENLKASENR